MKFLLIKKSKAFQKSYMEVVVKKLLRTGKVPARAWVAHAETFKLRRHMAAAGGKKVSTSLSLFLEAFGPEVDEEL